MFLVKDLTRAQQDVTDVHDTKDVLDSLRRGFLNGLDIHLGLDPGDIRLARVIGGNGGEVLAVPENVKGGPGQGQALLVLFHEDEPNFAHVLKSEQHVLLAGPFHGFHPRILQVTLRRGLLRDPVRAVGQFIPLEGDLAVEPGGASGDIAAVDLLKAEHRAL